MAQVRKSSVKNAGVNVPIHYYTPRGKKTTNYNNKNYKYNNINNYTYIYIYIYILRNINKMQCMQHMIEKNIT